MLKLTNIREPMNGLTHMAGVFLSAMASVFLLIEGCRAGTFRHIVGLGVFGFSLVALYTASTLYHTLCLSPEGVRFLRRLDQTMIVVLIAGTYTPVCTIALGNGMGWSLLAVIWTLACGGMTLALCWTRRPPWLFTATCVLIAWIAIFALPAIISAVPSEGVRWLIAGGLIYSAGLVVYALQRPNPIPGIFESHALWHLFVLGGSLCHIWAVARYIAPLG